MPLRMSHSVFLFTWKGGLGASPQAQVRGVSAVWASLLGRSGGMRQPRVRRWAPLDWGAI